MRIMLFSHGYPPTLSGVTLVVQKISRALVERGHNVLVVTASDRHLPYRSEDQGVQLERILGMPNPFWWEGPMPFSLPGTLHKLIDKFEPDIIHTHDNAYLGAVLSRLTIQPSIILITSCYTLPSFFTQFTRLRSFQGQIDRLMWRYYLSDLNRYEHVLFCTRTHEQAFKSHGLRPPTTVISNGVDIQRYCPQKELGENIESRYMLPPSPRILSVGRLMKDKRLDLLIRAMRVVCDQMEAHLLVVGRGSERHKLTSLIKHLQLEPYIHMLGYVAEQDLPALYRACGLFTIPSMVEVQSIPALQAVATGIPIVAADSAALPELVHDEVNGLLINPTNIRQYGEAILRIIADPAEQRRMGKASLEIAAPHDETITFKKYEQLYQELLAEPVIELEENQLQIKS
jgi:glycosyltransferase involved in cell wall biosynthesis